jgi:hypothetical protein
VKVSAGASHFSNVSRIDLYIEGRPLTSVEGRTAPVSIDLPLSATPGQRIRLEGFDGDQLVTSARIAI